MFRKPEACKFFDSACCSTGRIAPASMSEVVACVAEENAVPAAYFCGPIGGMNSGFSGARFAVFSAAATNAASASSLRSVPEAEPDFFPK